MIHLGARIRPLACLTLIGALAGCVSASTPPVAGQGAAIVPASEGTAATATLVRAGVLLATRQVMAGIQVYDRLKDPAQKKKFRLLQAEEEAESGESPEEAEAEPDQAEEASDVAEDEPVVADGDETADDDEYDYAFDESWYDDEEEAPAEIMASEDAPEFFTEWEQLSDEVDDALGEADEEEDAEVEAELKALKLAVQSLAVKRNLLTSETGERKLKELVNPAGEVRRGLMTYEPDEQAKTAGLPAAKLVYQVEKPKETGVIKTIDLKTELGGEQHQALEEARVQWGKAISDLDIQVRKDGSLGLSGTIQTDGSLKLSVEGVQRKDGSGDLTIIGPGYRAFFRNVRDLANLEGVVLDRDINDPEAHFIANVIVKQGQGTSLLFDSSMPLYRLGRHKGPSLASSTPPSRSVAGAWSIRDLALNRQAGQLGEAVYSGRVSVQRGGSAREVRFTGHDLPFMDNALDRFEASLAGAPPVSMEIDQEQTLYTFRSGRHTLTVERLPDGGFQVGDHYVTDHKAVTRLVAASAWGRSASPEGLVGLAAGLAHMPEESARTPFPCNTSEQKDQLMNYTILGRSVADRYDAPVRLIEAVLAERGF